MHATTLMVQHSLPEILRNTKQAADILWRLNTALCSVFPASWCWSVPVGYTQPMNSFLNLAYIPKSDLFPLGSGTLLLFIIQPPFHSSESAIAADTPHPHHHHHHHHPFLLSIIIVFPGNKNIHSLTLGKRLNSSNVVYDFK